MKSLKKYIFEKYDFFSREKLDSKTNKNRFINTKDVAWVVISCQ